MIKKKNDLLNKKYTYEPTLLSLEKIIRRLEPIIQYQVKVSTTTKKNNNWVANKLNEDYDMKDISTTDLFKYMKILHCPQEGSYMSLLKKYNKDDKEHAERWSLNTGEIEQLQRFESEGEFYCSVNSFFCPGRHSSKYIKRLNALFIGLDYYNIEELKDLNASEVFDNIKNEIDFPKESFVISSGSGLYNLWLLKTTYSTSSSQKYWSNIVKKKHYFKTFNSLSPYHSLMDKVHSMIV